MTPTVDVPFPLLHDKGYSFEGECAVQGVLNALTEKVHGRLCVECRTVPASRKQRHDICPAASGLGILSSFPTIYLPTSAKVLRRLFALCSTHMCCSWFADSGKTEEDGSEAAHAFADWLQDSRAPGPSAASLSAALPWNRCARKGVGL